MSEKVKEIQEQIDNNSLDLETLTEKQLRLLDDGFRSGALKGYKSVPDMARSILNTKEEIASQIQQAEETVPGINLPIVGQSFTERQGYETAGSVAGGFLVYGLNKKQLLDDIKMRGGQKFGPNYTQGFTQKTSKFADALQKIPLVKRLGFAGRLFSRTVGGLVDGVKKVDDAVRLGMTTPTKVELKSILGGGVAAAGGSALFDVVNSFDENTVQNVQADLSTVAEKEIDRLPGPQRVLARATEAFKTDLLFSGYGGLLGYTFTTVGKGFMKFLTGTGDQYSKDLAEAGQKYGINLNLGQVANENTTLGKFIKTYFQTLGVMPGVSAVTKKDRAVFENKIAGAMFQHAEDLAPITTERIMGYQAIDVLNNNYRQFQNLIDDSFAALKQSAESMGNPAIIPTKNLRSAAIQMIEEVNKLNIKDLPKEGTVLDKLDVKSLPINNLFLRFANQGIFSDKTHLTPLQYLGLKKDITKAIKESPNSKEILQAATSMRAAMDKDFFSLSDNMVQKEVVENSNSIKQVLESKQTQAEKNNYLNQMTKGIADFGEELKQDFHMFSALVDPFNSMTAKKLQDFGPTLFTTLSTLGIQGVAKKAPSEMFDTAIKNILRNGTPEAVQELKFLVGATDEGVAAETGKKFMERLGSRFLYDAFFKSFTYKPGDAITANMDLLQKAESEGMVRTVFADQILDATGTQGLISQRKIKGLETMDTNFERITRENFELDLDASRLGEFRGVDNLKKNLGLMKSDGTIDSMGKNRLVEVLGGGEKGKTQVKKLEQFLDVIDAGYSQVIGEGSKYLTRRIPLTGVSLGAGAVAGGLFGSVGGGLSTLILTPLLLRGFGGLISNPKRMQQLLDVYTPEQRIARATEGRLRARNLPNISLTQPLGKYLSPPKSRALGQLLNYFSTGEDDVPIDMNTITTQQVMDFLNKKKTIVPNTTIKINDLPDDMVKRIAPEVFIYRNAKLEDKKVYDEIMKGFAGGAAEVIAKEGTDAAVAQQQNVSAQQMMSRQPVLQQSTATGIPQSIRQQAPSNVAQRKKDLFASLFPNDPTLQLLNERQNART